DLAERDELLRELIRVERRHRILVPELSGEQSQERVEVVAEAGRGGFRDLLRGRGIVRRGDRIDGDGHGSDPDVEAAEVRPCWRAGPRRFDGEHRPFGAAAAAPLLSRGGLIAGLALALPEIEAEASRLRPEPGVSQRLLEPACG